MRRLIILGGLLLASSACVPTLSAQALPLTLTAQWDANPAADNVTGYKVYVDGTAPIDVKAPATSATFAVSLVGPHQVKVTAYNADGITGAVQESSPAIVTFVVNQVPSQPANAKVHK